MNLHIEHNLHIMSKKLWIIYLVVRKKSGSGSMLRGHTLSTFIFNPLTLFFVTFILKRRCHEMDIFVEGLNVLMYFVCRFALMVFKVFVGFLLYKYTNIYFLFTSIKFLTNFENLLKPSSETFIVSLQWNCAEIYCHRRLLLRFPRITYGFRGQNHCNRVGSLRRVTESIL